MCDLGIMPIRGNLFWSVEFRIASVIIRSRLSTCLSLTSFEHVQNLTTDQTTVAHPKKSVLECTDSL